MIFSARLLDKLSLVGMVLFLLLLPACKSPSSSSRDVIPPAYQNLTNPLIQVKAAGVAGEKLFMSNCAPCHGTHADGNGPAAMALPVKPANFLDPALTPKLTDTYLFWIISEGKAGTAMPKWKGVLNEQERWQVITYLRKIAGKHSASE